MEGDPINFITRIGYSGFPTSRYERVLYPARGNYWLIAIGECKVMADSSNPEELRQNLFNMMIYGYQ